MLIFTVKIVILVAGTLAGCLLMLLVSAVVCKVLKSVWVYREEASRRVIFIPAMNQIKHGRERKVQWETSYAMARWTRWFHQERRSAVQRSKRCAEWDGGALSGRLWQDASAALVEARMRGAVRSFFEYYITSSPHYSVYLTKSDQHQQCHVHDTDKQPQEHRNSGCEPIVRHLDSVHFPVALPSSHSHVLVSTGQVD